jgi:serine/threonine protein kinase
LGFIHKAGIVHRDIKPDNMLVVSPKEIRLGDFGVAVLPGENASLEDLQRGVGTMDYMAPEVLEGKTYSAASDIYSLGVSFYELLTSRHPFGGLPLAQQLEARLANKFIPILEIAPHVPEYVSAVITQAMRADPAARFASARDLAQALLVQKASAKIAPIQSQPQTPSSVASPKNAPTALASSAPQESPDARRAAARALLGKAAGKQAPVNSPSAAAITSAARPSSSPAAPLAPTNAKESKTATSNANAAALVAAWASMGLTKSGATKKESPPTPKSPTTTSQTASAATTSPLPKQVEYTPPVPQKTEAPLEQKQTLESESQAQKKSESAREAAAEPRTESIATQASTPHIHEAQSAAEAADARVMQPDSPYLKSTQVITKDLISRVRADFADEKPEKQASIEPTPQPQPATKSLASMAMAAHEAQATPELNTAPQIEKNAAPLKQTASPQDRLRAGIHEAALRIRNIAQKIISQVRSDDKRQRYVATTTLTCIFLFLGNLFLVRTYNVGIAKSYLGGTNEERISPLPSFQGDALAFPQLPAGVYRGATTGILGDTTTPLSVISLEEQKKLIVILGLPGWKPSVVSLDEIQNNSSGIAEIRIASGGLVFQLSGQADKNGLKGVITALPAGTTGEWVLNPVVKE